MMGNYHVPFWRAVEGATPSLTLILRDEGLRILTSGTGDKAMKCGLGGFPHEQLHQEACRPEISRSNRGRKKSTTVLSVGQEADTVPSGQCG
ncbi:MULTISPECIES: hypothetical protein [Nostocales]|uniref:hypothetical protein n=1 Tax=Nostocales TaxID=1161 RepID=UPI001F4263B8|nr:MULTISPECIES: hypothetical protein [Nostocales]